jgi:hypothetical protein
MTLQIAHPMSIICLHVDDLCLIATENTVEEVLCEAESMVAMAIHEFTEIKRLPFVDDKTFVISTDSALTKAAANNMLPSATVAGTVRRLGVYIGRGCLQKGRCTSGVQAKTHESGRQSQKG